MKAATVKGKKKSATKVDGVSAETMESMVDIFKSLADAKRLQIVLLLAREGSKNVTAICEALGGESQPAVSHHLKQLSHAKLVKHDRDGKFNFYMLDSTVLERIIHAFFPNSRSVQQKVTYGDLELLFKAK